MNSTTTRLLTGIALIGSLASPLAAKRPSPGSDPISHTARQDGAIQLGSSGGWANDLANGYCCGGTLGALVKLPDGSFHILSNFHVLAADVVPGGNGIIAVPGDSSWGRVIHPGLIDVGCNVNDAKDVAVLSEVADPLLSDLPKVDAALAQIIPGAVSEVKGIPDGAILGIGVIANETLPVADVIPGLAVKKSGRTTGFTRSKIEIINATVTITYENECAGAVRGSATFEGQIVAGNRGSAFLDSGDSGSLMVEDTATTPRAVGLLFAGSSLYAIANPIDHVLGRFSDATGDATMVGVDYVASSDSGDSGSGSGGKGQGKPKNERTGLDRAASVHKNNRGLLNAVAHSNGHGVGVDEAGNPYIAVLVESLSTAPLDLPSSIEGVAVQVVEVGRLVAF